jgi:hypothetical protein
MTNREKPMAHRYWKRMDGTLLEEYLAVARRQGVGQRKVDAVIVVDGARRIASRGEHASLDGHDLIVVQTKAHRLAMYLLGQALFSRVLIKKRCSPRTLRTVALCAENDAVLGPIAKRFGIEVVVDKPDKRQ